VAKKTRSRKQKAATRKLIRFNKSKGRKKAKTRRKSSSKRKSSGKRRRPNKRKTTNKTVTRRTGKKKFIDKIPILRNPTVQKIAFGLGIGLIAIKIIDLAAQVAPPALAAPLVKNKRIIQLGVELATEPLSAVVDVATGGGIGSIGNILGRSNGQTQQVSQNGNGFA